MHILDFLTNLELFYKYSGSEENKIKVFNSYVENLEGICLNNKCDYDWSKVILAIQRGYKKREFPLLADIINFLPEGKIEKQYQPCKGEGSLVIITLPTGQKYSFTVCVYGKSKETIVDEIKTKYGICDVNIYPAGSVLIGNKVVEP